MVSMIVVLGWWLDLMMLEVFTTYLNYSMILWLSRSDKVLINQQPRVLVLRAALNPFSAQPVFVLGTVLTQVQNLVLVELHEVFIVPPLKPVQTPLDIIPSLQCVKCTTQLEVICKVAECTLNPPSMLVTKMLNSTSPRTKPSCHWFLLVDIESLTPELLIVTNSLIHQVAHHFRDEDGAL